ncbi:MULTISPECIES: hypothetical protein [Methylomonas]|uniref:Lipoprotein n=1 Tax=Methylomonas methanica TaxID=421 RepID=A0ABY2CPZ4_METMH|nr:MULTISPECIES: hypothetical protein [Methylomonas]TCV86181.1 hypothetical protein EDE11_104125 [Methylomonas methanica]
MKTKLPIALLLTVGLASACSELNPHPMDYESSGTTRNIQSRS